MNLLSNTTSIILILIALICIALIFLIIIYNKFQYILIKMTKANTNIEYNLVNKYNILVKFINLLNETIKIDIEDFSEYINMNTDDSVEKDFQLNQCYAEIKKVLENNEKLTKKDNFINLLNELKYVNINLTGSKNYYNNTLIEYNKLVKCFPSKICACILKYKEKEFFKEVDAVNLKILNNNEE